MGRQLHRLASVLAYLIFLAVFVEIALQAFYFFTAGGFLFARVGRPIFAANPHSGFWNKPNLSMEHNTSEFQTHVYTNSDGFRVSAAHEEYPVAKDPAKLRVMLLGPSFAFGWGVDQEETTAVRLEGLLERNGFAGGRDVELINAGVPSLPPYPQLRWFKERGRDFAPDLVVQFIYGSMAVDTSPAYAKLRSLYGNGEPAEGIQGAGRELTENESFDPSDPNLASALAFYGDLRAAVESTGGRLLVVYLPHSYCVHLEDVSRWAHLGVRKIEEQKAFDDAFCRHIDQNGVPCLNITQDLVSAAREHGERLYYWLDIHWTPEGNAVAAQAIAGRLLEGGAGPGGSERDAAP